MKKSTLLATLILASIFTLSRNQSPVFASRPPGCSCDWNATMHTTTCNSSCGPKANTPCLYPTDCDTPVVDCYCENGLCNSSCVEANQNKPCKNDFDCSVISNPHCTACSIIFFIFKILVPWVFGLGILAAVVFLVIGGIRYTTAGDDPKKITDAKGTITWSVVGLVILILAAAIIRLVWIFFGFEEGKIFLIPTLPGEGGVAEPVLDCTACQN